MYAFQIQYSLTWPVHFIFHFRSSYLYHFLTDLSHQLLQQLSRR